MLSPANVAAITELRQAISVVVALKNIAIARELTIIYNKNNYLLLYIQKYWMAFAIYAKTWLCVVQADDTAFSRSQSNMPKSSNS